MTLSNPDELAERIYGRFLDFRKDSRDYDQGQAADPAAFNWITK